MNWNYSLCVLSLSASCIYGLSPRAEESIIAPRALSANDMGDPPAMPVMSNFDLKKFSGSWFELSKSTPGYIDVIDGFWKIQFHNTTGTFIFSARDFNGHCIQPIKGNMYAVDELPGLLNLHYEIYLTQVVETIRVLFTDYTTFAVIYLCVHHIHREKEICHPEGMIGAVWTRKPHVEFSVYENALRYLETVCVHKSVLILRNQFGPCQLDKLGFRIDEFPVPDFCYQPKDLGHCRGSIKQYHYSPKEKKCEIFSYSGCGGNKNSFDSFQECKRKCLSPLSRDHVCTSISKCAIHCPPCCSKNRKGCAECNCERITVDLEKFPDCEFEEYHPGCYVWNCDDISEPETDPPECLEVQAKGECSDQIERFYYNALTEECEKFTYTGCGGNNNNFETEEECMQICRAPKRGDVLTDEDDDEGDGAVTIMHTGWLVTITVLLFTILALD